MIKTPAAIVVMVTTALAASLAGCSNTSNVNKSGSRPSLQNGEKVFAKRAYATVGAGASYLSPISSDTDTVVVEDHVDSAGQAGVGFDITPNLSAELHSADLGSASLNADASVNYQTNGASVLWYKGRQQQHRKGLMGYGRFGLAQTDTTAEGNVQVETNAEAQVMFGAGLEYMGRNVGMRGEIIAYNSDAQYAQLGLIYRLGKTSAPGEPITDYTSAPPEITIPTAPDTATAEAAPEEPELPTLIANIDTPVDSDADGIPDNLDSCPSTDATIQVDDTGCAIFNGVIDGVNFARGSAMLTVEAQRTLDKVGEVLRQYPDASIAITAHTDDIGREQDNLALSRDRAVSVAAYLISRGVSKSLMTARAFGEYQPIAENGTPEGRALNRRVEIVAGKSNPES